MASKPKTGEELKKVWSLGKPLGQMEKKPTTGEDLKKVWSVGSLDQKEKKPKFDPTEAWLKGGKKKRITRKRQSKKKWTSSATRKRN
jgi:hypothetical protein